MKKKEKIFFILLISLIAVIIVVIPSSAHMGKLYDFSISDKKMNVEKGDKIILTVSGSAAILGKTTWISSNDNILKIESVESGNYLNNGYKVKISAINSGEAAIIAENNKCSEVLSCIITVGNKDKETKTDKPIITKAYSFGTSKAGKIELEWSAMEDASKYQIQISKKADFSTILRKAVTEDTHYDTAWTFYNRIGGSVEVYYCRVKAVINGTETDWSDTVICTTK